jgi:hypothetical protein
MKFSSARSQGNRQYYSSSPFFSSPFLGKEVVPIMVNSETPQNVRPTVPVDRSGFNKKFKCLKGKKKIPNVEYNQECV